MLVQVLAFVPLTAQCCHALTTPYTPTSRSMQAHAPSARLDLRHVRRASSWARYAVIKSVSTSGRVQQPVMLGAGCTATLNDIRAKLAAVRALRPLEETKEVQTSLWEAAGIDPIYKVSGSVSGEPSFTRLFTHETWSSYNGKPPLRRWLRTAATWRYSTILRSVYPITIIASMWAIFVASLPSRLLPRTSPVPMSLMGTALGLLLVFRTNNSYQRLGEARGLWGRAVYLCRELAQGVATALLYDDNVEDPDQAREAAASICAYLVAWAWETNARLTGKPAEGKSPPRQRDGPLPGEDLEVLRALLPRAEAEWIGAQRSRPLQLIGSIRRSLHQQYRRGNLPWHIHRKLEEDVRGLDLVLGGCERLFSSPVPPTMSRHVIRCLILWLLGLPLVLASSMAPLAVGAWVFVTSYIFVGIEEVGVQVEQAFEIVPMTGICNIIMLNIEETLKSPPEDLAPSAA